MEVVTPSATWQMGQNESLLAEPVLLYCLERGYRLCVVRGTIHTDVQYTDTLRFASEGDLTAQKWLAELT